MRPKIVIIVLLAGAIGLAAILFLKPANKVTPPPPVVVDQPAVVAPKTNPIVAQVQAPPTNAAPATPRVKHIPFTTPEVTGEDAPQIQATINRLDDLSMNDDDASLQAILKELTNTNPIIRHEAIEATIQFGGHTAVPVLKDLASRTWDPNEKQELLDAAEFLSLPTWSEVKAQNPDMKLPDGLAPAGQP